MKIIATRHVLAVPNAEATARFFCDKLGFTRVPVNDDGWRFVQRDGFHFMFGTCEAAIPPAQLGDHQYFAYVNVDAVDALYDELKGRGVAATPPASKPWGMREVFVQTPDGHRMVFGQSLKS